MSEKSENNMAAKPEGKQKRKTSKAGTQSTALAVKQPTKFDELTEKKQINILEKVVSETPEIDMVALRQTLQARGITKEPGEELIAMAMSARKELAGGSLAIFRARDLIQQTYERARKDKHNPQDARLLVKILVTGNGAYLSEKQMLRYLPDEAKASQQREAGKAAAASKKAAKDERTNKADRAAQEKAKSAKSNGEKTADLIQVYVAMSKAHCDFAGKLAKEGKPALVLVNIPERRVMAVQDATAKA